MSDIVVIIILVIIAIIVWDQISLRKRKQQTPRIPPKTPKKEENHVAPKSTFGESQNVSLDHRPRKASHHVLEKGLRSKEKARDTDVSKSIIRKYSYTSLETFDECSRKFFYKYIQSIDPAFQSIEAFTGSTIHDVLKWAYEMRDLQDVPSRKEGDVRAERALKR